MTRDQVVEVVVERASENQNMLDGEGAIPGVMRAFAGPQRFLEDTLRGHEWFSFRLQLPGGQDGLTDLPKVRVALGDGGARRTGFAMRRSMGTTQSPGSSGSGCRNACSTRR